MTRRDHDIAEELGDFTTTPRLLTIIGFALIIGIVGAYVALGLLRLIGLFTNLLFFQRVSTTLADPEAHTLGPFVIIVPVIGALIIGFMARYGSDRTGSSG
jgi:chloride channel protein, CIC family